MARTRARTVRFGKRAVAVMTAVVLGAWGLAVGPAGAIDAMRLTDLAITQITAIDGGFAVTVSESAQNVDLNGDGDRFDAEIFAVTPGQAPIRTGLPGTSATRVPGGLQVVATESALGSDGTGDGDLADTVAATWDPLDGTAVVPYALGGGYYPVVPVLLSDGARAMYLSEVGEGLDLNGDTDLADSVFHVVRPDGTLVNVGLAGGSSDFNLIVPLPAGGAAMTIGEAPGSDLNGDGDTTDSVVGVWTESGVEVTPLAVMGFGGDVTPLPSGLLVSVPERRQGADLNVDGDQLDDVPVLWSPDASTVIPIAAGRPSALLTTGEVAFAVIESAQANRDRNGDGDLTDRVLAIWDPVDPSVIANLGIAVYGTAPLADGALAIATLDGALHVRSASGDILTAPFGAASRLPTIVDSSRLATITPEGSIDRNGDGDVADTVPVVWDWTTSSLIYAPAAVHSSTTVGIGPDGWLLLGVSEVAESDDLNGDGDAVDVVLRLWSTAVGFGPLAVASTYPLPVVSAGWLAFAVNENADGRGDRNGDNDAADTVLGLYGDLPDGDPPAINGLAVTPAQVGRYASVVVTASVEDATSTITRATLVYGFTNLTMTPVDGAYDETAEDVRATVAASGTLGSYPVCLVARDAAGIESAVSCTTLVVADIRVPVVTAAAASPLLAQFRVPVTVTATATSDDRFAGAIVSLEMSVDGATSWTPMTADDGAFDEPLESASGTTSFATSGSHAILVRAVDGAGNVSGTVALWIYMLPDAAAPTVTALAARPEEARIGETVTVTATGDDGSLGSDVFLEMSVDAGTSWTTMSPDDGAFDEPLESASATTSFATAGSKTILVRAYDRAGNLSAPSSVTVLVVAPDTQPPVVTSLDASPEGARLGATVTVTATGDDRSTGASGVALQVSVDNGTSWTAMAPDDGAFDEPLESATATTSFTSVGSHMILVRAVDDASNIGGLWSVDVLAYEPSGVVVAYGDLAGADKKGLTIQLNARYGKAGQPVGSIIINGPGLDLQSTELVAMAIGNGEAWVWARALINGEVGRVRITLTDRREGQTVAIGAVLDNGHIALWTSATLRTGAVIVRR